MQVTPITIPATDNIDRLRESIMLALNRMASQINRAQPAAATGLTESEVLGLIRGLRSEVYNISTTAWSDLINITIDGTAVTY